MEQDGVARPLEMEQQNLETSHLLVCLVSLLSLVFNCGKTFCSFFYEGLGSRVN